MAARPETVRLTSSGEEDVSLLDILDHVLNQGVVLHGSLVISVAGVDLVYVGLNAVLTSVETALRTIEKGHSPKPSISAGAPRRRKIS